MPGAFKPPAANTGPAARGCSSAGKDPGSTKLQEEKLGHAGKKNQLHWAKQAETELQGAPGASPASPPRPEPALGTGLAESCGLSRHSERRREKQRRGGWRGPACPEGREGSSRGVRLCPPQPAGSACASRARGAAARVPLPSRPGPARLPQLGPPSSGPAPLLSPLAGLTVRRGLQQALQGLLVQPLRQVEVGEAGHALAGCGRAEPGHGSAHGGGTAPPARGSLGAVVPPCRAGGPSAPAALWVPRHGLRWPGKGRGVIAQVSGGEPEGDPSRFVLRQRSPGSEEHPPSQGSLRLCRSPQLCRARRAPRSRRVPTRWSGSPAPVCPLLNRFSSI